MISKTLLSAVLLGSSFFARAQWAVVDTIDQANFRGIHFWDAQHGIVGGETGGRFFKTANSGSAWSTAATPFSSGFSAMQFVDAQHGFACGGSGFSPTQNILVGTNDAGQTWDTLTVNAPNAPEFSGVNFKNKDTGIVFGYSYAFKTYNGGHTLIRMNRPDTNFYLQDVQLLQDNSILAAGSLIISANVQRIYRSVDWGATWTIVYTDNLIGIASMAIKNGSGFAACSNGRILTTSNNGLTWTKTQIATDTTYFTKARFGANGEMYLLAYVGTDGYVYGSNDGIAWQSAQVSINEAVIDISMPTKSTGYVISFRKVYRTITGGGMTLSVKNTPSELEAIDVYPNPANAVINIRNQSGIKITSVAMYDVTGKLVKKEAGETKTINTSGMPKGNYLLEITTAENKSTRKIVLE